MAQTDYSALAIERLGLKGDAGAALQALLGPPKRLRGGEPVAIQEEPVDGLAVVLDGVLKSSCTLADGTTQTLALFLAGDLTGLQAAALDRSTASVVAVSSAQIRRIAIGPLMALVRSRPEIGAALWRATAREAAILHEWMLGMGRRTALSRIAHLFCEIVVRLKQSGQLEALACDLPLTQAELADAAGLSVVHVNRVMQSLRTAGLVEYNRGRLEIIDWPKLVHLGEFDPAYLGLGARHAPVLLPSRDATGA